MRKNTIKLIKELEGYNFKNHTFTKKEINKVCLLGILEQIINLPKIIIGLPFILMSILFDCISRFFEFSSELFENIANKIRWTKDIQLVKQEEKMLIIEAIKNKKNICKTIDKTDLK